MSASDAVPHLTEEENARYERQLRVWGVDAQRRMKECKVLVMGRCSAAAIEVAKNIVLVGVGAVVLMDDTQVTPDSRGANFFIPPDAADATFAAACVEGLQALNPNVRVSAAPCPASGSWLDVAWGNFSVVVASQLPLDAQLAVSRCVAALPAPPLLMFLHSAVWHGHWFIDHVPGARAFPSLAACVPEASLAGLAPLAAWAHAPAAVAGASAAGTRAPVSASQQRSTAAMYARRSALVASLQGTIAPAPSDAASPAPSPAPAPLPTLPVSELSPTSAVLGGAAAQALLSLVSRSDVVSGPAAVLDARRAELTVLAPPPADAPRT